MDTREDDQRPKPPPPAPIFPPQPAPVEFVDPERAGDRALEELGDRFVSHVAERIPIPWHPQSPRPARRSDYERVTRRSEGYLQPTPEHRSGESSESRSRSLSQPVPSPMRRTSSPGQYPALSPEGGGPTPPPKEPLRQDSVLTYIPTWRDEPAARPREERRHSRLSTGVVSAISTLGPGSAHRPDRPTTVAERIQPTLDSAISERDKVAFKASIMGITLNIALGLQVLFGALTTGLAAATSGRTTSIVVAIFGGCSTIVATYLARLRGSNEPELSTRRATELSAWIREANTVITDHGWRAVNKGEKVAEEDDGPPVAELERIIENLRSNFEHLMGNLTREETRRNPGA